MDVALGLMPLQPEWHTEAPGMSTGQEGLQIESTLLPVCVKVHECKWLVAFLFNTSERIHIYTIQKVPGSVALNESQKKKKFGEFFSYCADYRKGNYTSWAKGTNE